jgi:hypothetical protein
MKNTHILFLLSLVTLGNISALGNEKFPLWIKDVPIDKQDDVKSWTIAVDMEMQKVRKDIGKNQISNAEINERIKIGLENSETLKKTLPTVIDVCKTMKCPQLVLKIFKLLGIPIIDMPTE